MKLSFNNERNDAFPNKTKIVLIIACWIFVTGLFFTGALKFEPVGHLEVSLLMGFVVIALGLHLWSLLTRFSGIKYG